MNDFHVIAHGEEFDVDAFLATTTLRSDFVWRRGDQRSVCSESPHPTSGIQLSLGDGLSVSLWDQEKIALAYLQDHQEELRALRQFPGVQWLILSLNYFFSASDDGILRGAESNPSRPWRDRDRCSAGIRQRVARFAVDPDNAGRVSSRSKQRNATARRGATTGASGDWDSIVVGFKNCTAQIHPLSQPSK